MQVRAALAEKGIPYRSRMVGPSDALPRFGNAAVVLVDGVGVLTGPLPILDHLEARWPEPPLFPDDPGRPAVVTTLARLDTTFAPEISRIDRGIPVERARALGVARTLLGDLDGTVAERGYLLGAFSAADLALASYVASLPPDWRSAALGFRRLARWEHAVMSRPTVREQMAPVGL
jgi:glutathione S-transferase